MLVNYEQKIDLMDITGHIIQYGLYNSEKNEYYYEGLTLHVDDKDMDFILYDGDKMVFTYDALSGVLTIEDNRIIQSLIELIDFDYMVNVS